MNVNLINFQNMSATPFKSNNNPTFKGTIMLTEYQNGKRSIDVGKCLYNHVYNTNDIEHIHENGEEDHVVLTRKDGSSDIIMGDIETLGRLWELAKPNGRYVTYTFDKATLKFNGPVIRDISEMKYNETGRRI